MCPKDEFTLTKLKELNLDETPQSLEAVTKVCDVAGKEYAIEQVTRPPHTWHRTPLTPHLCARTCPPPHPLPTSPTSHLSPRHSPLHDRAQALDKMEAEWKGVNLEIVEYRETQTYVLKGFDEIQQLLDDHIVMTQSMSFSPFKGPFAQRIDEWEKLLVLMSDIFEEWLKCQRSWMYLEPIFSSEDIMRQLPTEGKRFAGVDRTWRKTLNAAHHDPDAVTFCKTPRLLQHFQEGNQMLEMVQNGRRRREPPRDPTFPPASPHIPPAAGPKGARRVPRDQARLVRPLLLPEQRRAARDLIADKGPAGGAGVTGPPPLPLLPPPPPPSPLLTPPPFPPLVRAAPPQEVLREHREGEVRGRPRDVGDDLGRGRDRPLQGATRRLRQHHCHCVA